MIIANPAFIVVTYVYDGLFKGGMLVIMYEATAELGYPVGESISLGLLNALQYTGRFFINFLQSSLVNPLLPLTERRVLQHDLLWLYISLLVIYFVFNIAAIILLLKSEFTLKRSIEDACFYEEIEADDPRINQNDDSVDMPI